jgi:hypothetical protein
MVATFETAVVDKPAEEEEHGHHHGHAHQNWHHGAPPDHRRDRVREQPISRAKRLSSRIGTCRPRRPADHHGYAVGNSVMAAPHNAPRLSRLGCRRSIAS